MQDRGGAGVQIKHSLCDLNRESSAFFPGDVVVSVLQVRPEGPFGAVFQNDAVIGIGGDCA